MIGFDIIVITVLVIEQNKNNNTPKIIFIKNSK